MENDFSSGNAIMFKGIEWFFSEIINNYVHNYEKLMEIIGVKPWLIRDWIETQNLGIIKPSVEKFKKIYKE